MINVFQPSLGEAELNAVAEVFADNWLGHGPRTAAFEAEFAAHLGVPADRVVFLASATAGLYLTTELLGLGPGDEVVMPSISFVSAASAVASTGARPVFCDVDPDTLNPSAEQIARALTDRTRAVLVLHYGGGPGDIARIAELCESRGVTLVEDTACAVASRVGPRACGTFGSLSVWSFDAMKVLSTGDGGMLYAADPVVAERARRLAYHGLAQSSGLSAARNAAGGGPDAAGEAPDAAAGDRGAEADANGGGPDGTGTGPTSPRTAPGAPAPQPGAAGARVPSRWWDLDVRDFGRRVIGNDLTAAIGSVQLRRLEAIVDRRGEVAAAYDRLLSPLDGVRLPPPLPPDHTTSYYFYWVRLDPRIRDAVASDLLGRGVYTTFRYPPLHRVPAYGHHGPPLPHTESAAEATLLLPLHQGLSDADVATVAAEFRASVEARTPARPTGLPKEGVPA
ncbi:DegT/DnrJ/EryC1/StrS family aminotransferase [Streptomyces californicus]|uniref:DegT/DnrJ/EryC1/StrS family aminotransferase n=1 Tax=Streptomyces californicus TaxID=67351 RepID=UPI0033EA654B